MGKNLKGKLRKVEEPYEIYTQDDWEWRVLKHWQSPEAEVRNPYARVFCAVRSPYTRSGWEYGDTYCTSIPGFVFEGASN